MPIRVLKPQVGGTAAALVEGFDYAGDMGADIVNASLSGQGTVQSVQDVVEDHPDTLYVVAAGQRQHRRRRHRTDPLALQRDRGQHDLRRGHRPERQPRELLELRSDLGGPRRPGHDRPLHGERLGRSWPAPATTSRPTTSSPAGRPRAPGPGPNEAGGGRLVVDDRLARGGLRGRHRREREDRDALRPHRQAGVLRALRHAPAHRDQLRQAEGRDLVRTARDWTTRKEWSGVLAGGDFASYSTYLFSDGGQPYVRFRLTTDDEGLNDDGVHLDNVRVLCKGSTYDSSNYKYFQGTSMATPHVSGTAALALSLRPTATVAELRAALLETGDPAASLAGKTVTGKRLNALRRGGARWAARGDRRRHRRRGHRGEAATPRSTRSARPRATTSSTAPTHRLRQRDHAEERGLGHHTGRGERHGHGAPARAPSTTSAWSPPAGGIDVTGRGRRPSPPPPAPRRRRRSRASAPCPASGRSRSTGTTPRPRRATRCSSEPRRAAPTGHPGGHRRVQRAHGHRPHRRGPGSASGCRR